MRRRAAIGLAILARALAAGVVTDCTNDTQFSSLLSGGNVIFNCGGVGAAAAIDTSTRGAKYFDAFESRRQTYIGS